MSEDRVICSECGKEVSGASSICEECGARNFNGRPVRSKPRKGQEAKDTRVAPLTDAMRLIPRAPKRDAASGRRHKSRDRHSASGDGPRPSRRLPSVHSASSHPEQPAGGAETMNHQPRRLSRRKIYRYDRSDKKKSKYGTEIRAILLVIVGGIVLILMCRVADVEGSVAEPAHPRAVSSADHALPASPAPVTESARADAPPKPSETTPEKGIPTVKPNHPGKSGVRKSSAPPTIPHTGGL